jgi:hypothetical protein
VVAQRNGTVSGTAACFALSITAGDVFFCGLDLAPGKGFQHSLPNRLETENQTKDFRLTPLVGRCSLSSLSSGALGIYRAWFAAQDDSFASRIYRITFRPYGNSLGKIRELSGEEAEDRLHSLSKVIKPKIVPCPQPKNRRERADLLWDMLKSLQKDTTSDTFLKAVFPAECVRIRRSGEEPGKNDVLKQKTAEFVEKLGIFVQQLPGASCHA